MHDDPPVPEDDPASENRGPNRRGGDPITDFGAVAFISVLFLLALGLMYLIGPGHG